MLGLRTQVLRHAACPSSSLVPYSLPVLTNACSKIVAPTGNNASPLSHKSFPMLQPQSTSFPAAITLFSRNASTSANPTDTSAAASNPNDGTLTWNAYLRLRRIRRRFNLISSVSTAVTGFAVGLSILSQQNMEQLGNVMFGMDPMFVAGLWSLGFITIGWLLGPIVGTGVFRLIYRKQLSEMAKKEKNFFERIRRFRVDPSSSSVQNPVPDYYGEKITSVQGYRQWLKDQRAFNKKRQSFV